MQLGPWNAMVEVAVRRTGESNYGRAIVSRAAKVREMRARDASPVLTEDEKVVAFPRRA